MGGREGSCLACRGPQGQARPLPGESGALCSGCFGGHSRRTSGVLALWADLILWWQGLGPNGPFQLCFYPLMAPGVWPLWDTVLDWMPDPTGLLLCGQLQFLFYYLGSNVEVWIWGPLFFGILTTRMAFFLGGTQHSICAQPRSVPRGLHFSQFSPLTGGQKAP